MDLLEVEEPDDEGVVTTGTIVGVEMGVITGTMVGVGVGVTVFPALK